MAQHRVGSQTFTYSGRPTLAAGASVVGPREGKGPIGQKFDVVKDDALLGEKSWERAEAKMLQEACDLVITRTNRQPSDIHLFLGGDLLNQLIAANFCARELSIPFIGLYGACSTMVEALVIGAAMVDSGYADAVLCGASSHHDTAERQYRFPTEFATQRPPTSQWTVTGAGAVVIDRSGGLPAITHGTVGRVIDMGMQDPNDMGSPMAAAAAETIWQHLSDTGRSPADYDAIVTGDLGSLGRSVTIELLKRANISVGDRLEDCGLMMFEDKQDAHSGGSGGGCCAAVLCAHLMPQLAFGQRKRILFVGTGALFSPTSHQQGESIPCVAHAVAIEGMGS